MAFFSNLKLIGIGVVLISMLGGIFYVNNLRKNLEISELNNSKLKDSLQNQEKLIKVMKEDFNKIKKINDTLIKTTKVQEQEIKNLNKKFTIQANGQSRDLGKITIAKPGLVNKIINDATKDVNRCFELASGAPLKEGETNNECQNFINSIDK